MTNGGSLLNSCNTDAGCLPCPRSAPFNALDTALSHLTKAHYANGDPQSTWISARHVLARDGANGRRVIRSWLEYDSGTKDKDLFPGAVIVERFISNERTLIENSLYVPSVKLNATRHHEMKIKMDNYLLKCVTCTLTVNNGMMTREFQVE